MREGLVEYPYFPDQLPQVPTPKPMFYIRGVLLSDSQLGRIGVGDLDDFYRTGDFSRIAELTHRDPEPR